MTAQELQKLIFTNGVISKRPIIPVDANSLKIVAEKHMCPKAKAYIQSAGTGNGAINNLQAINQYKIIPKMMVNSKEFSSKINLFGKDYSSPLMLGPVGVLDLFSKKGDLKTAQAAANKSVNIVFSNQASIPMEACASSMNDSSRWFQLYWSQSNELVRSLVTRAEKCGCSAIVWTVDTTLLGWRPQDLDAAYLPFLEGRGIAQYSSDPVFNSIMDSNEFDLGRIEKPKLHPHTFAHLIALCKRYPGSFFSNLVSKRPITAVRLFIHIFSRTNIDWSLISKLKEMTNLPILIKGILDPSDAKKAINAGADGIVVSNHGGRQIDHVISSFDSLDKIARQIDSDFPLIVDSGIRTGADMFIALALGAKAVFIARQYIYGLTLKGQKGVEAVIDHFLAEFELTMRLAGCKSPSEINRNHIHSD